MQIILQEIMEKNDTWNIRRLVNEMIVPVTQQPSVLHILKIVGRISNQHEIFMKIEKKTRQPGNLTIQLLLMDSKGNWSTY